MEGLTGPLTLVVLIGAATAALGVIYRFIHRASVAVHLILYELQPNGGQSIVDRVQRIDTRVEALEDWRRRHEDH